MNINDKRGFSSLSCQASMFVFGVLATFLFSILVGLAC